MHIVSSDGFESWAAWSRCCIFRAHAGFKIALPIFSLHNHMHTKLHRINFANLRFYIRPMKNKSGPSAGIPRASGERASPVGGNNASSNGQVRSQQNLKSLPVPRQSSSHTLYFQKVFTLDLRGFVRSFGKLSNS